MYQEPIPPEYFVSDCSNKMLLPAKDFCEYVAFIFDLDLNNQQHFDALESCIKRIINFVIMDNHQNLDYRDDFDHLLNTLTQYLYPIKGALSHATNYTTIQKLIEEAEGIFEFYVINDWGFYDITVDYPDVYCEYLGDYRIIRWSMSHDAARYRNKNAQQRIKEVFHTLRRT